VEKEVKIPKDKDPTIIREVIEVYITTAKKSLRTTATITGLTRPIITKIIKANMEKVKLMQMTLEEALKIDIMKLERDTIGTNKETLKAISYIYGVYVETVREKAEKKPAELTDIDIKNITPIYKEVSKHTMDVAKLANAVIMKNIDIELKEKEINSGTLADPSVQEAMDAMVEANEEAKELYERFNNPVDGVEETSDNGEVTNVNTD
jgi:hypothetical protein